MPPQTLSSMGGMAVETRVELRRNGEDTVVAVYAVGVDYVTISTFAVRGRMLLSLADVREDTLQPVVLEDNVKRTVCDTAVEYLDEYDS